MEKVGVFFIVEPGRLEYQAEIFIKSLRAFGGIKPELPIYCFQPRKSGEISKRTFKLFDEYHVIFEKVNLNREFFFYPLANKILTGEYFEKKYGDQFERTLFFDSDFMIQDSIESLIQLSNTMGLVPEFVDTWAIKEGTQPGPMWQVILDKMELNPEDFWKVKSGVDEQSILAYYNGGLICTQPKVQLFSRWMTAFKKIMNDPRILSLDHKEFYFLEMGSLAATLVNGQHEKEIEEVSLDLNFPLELTQQGLAKAKAIHFMDYFTSFDFHSLPIKSELKEIIQEAIEYKREAPAWVRLFQIAKFQFFKLKLKGYSS